ncbi:MAG: protein kinase [Kiritimatiellia bacterium]|nr:protein kinase [Kiritimatiellia bacterium]
MPTERTCDECGSVVPDSAPMGLCPQCLLGCGLGAQDRSTTGGFETPSLSVMRERFPGYEILELLGRGGMGIVYKARQSRLERLVAIKIIPFKKDMDVEASERFLREAKTLASLNHPNIITVYDFGEIDGLCYFVMEFVEGCNLWELLSARSISPYDAMNITLGVCNGLQHAHDRGVVHRDIKPANILIDKSGVPKIADFGLAKILACAPGAPLLTASGQSMGTPFYMAPEQRDQSVEVDQRADVYALGVIMYEMLTAQLPAGNVKPPSTLAQVPRGLDHVVLKAMEPNPDHRYQRADGIVSDIEALASAGVIPGTGGRKPSRFSPVILTVIVSAAVLAALFGGARFLSKEPPPQDVIVFGNHFYKVFYENTTWHDARRRCERMGGRLAIVESKAEDEFLAAISRSHVWIGATDEDEEGQWKWLDGSELAYSNWDADEPNNAPGRAAGTYEDYLMISKYAKWNDLSLDSEIIKGFICEWDASSHPGPARVRTPEQLHKAFAEANPYYSNKAGISVVDGNIVGVSIVHAGVVDLSPLRGLSLRTADISWSDVTDLSPIENAPLSELKMSRSKVTDLSALAGMQLVSLRIDGTGVHDLIPLKGMPLTYLDISHTRVTDLSPLAGMPLKELHMNCARVSDLSPVSGLPLTKIGLLDSPAGDLSPLGECKLLESANVPENATGIECLRELPLLERLNGKTVEEFWKEWEERAE